MPWLALTTARLAVLPQVLERVKAMHPDDDGAATIAAAIADQTAYIRGAIKRGTVLDADTTLLPPELLTHAAWLTVEQLLVPLSNIVELTTDQRTLIATAHKVIEQNVPAGRMQVSAPDNPETSPTMQSGGGSIVVTAGCRQATRQKLAGL